MTDDPKKVDTPDRDFLELPDKTPKALVALILVHARALRRPNEPDVGAMPPSDFWLVSPTDIT